MIKPRRTSRLTALPGRAARAAALRGPELRCRDPDLQPARSDDSWGAGTWSEFYRHIDLAEADPQVRVIVITEAGRAFCAGADMGGLDAISGGHRRLRQPDRRQLRWWRPGTRASSAADQTRHRRDQRAVAGMGLSRALMAAVRFAAAGARSTSFARRGLVAGTEALSGSLLPRLVGLGHRHRSCCCRTGLPWPGRPPNSGWSGEVVPRDELMDRVLAYADDMAINCAPSSMAMMKKRKLYADAGMGIVETSHKAELMRFDADGPVFIEGRHGILREALSTSRPYAGRPAPIEPKGPTDDHAGGPAGQLDYRAIDNHYYEPIDAFTRHLPKGIPQCGVRIVAGRQKRTLAVFGGVAVNPLQTPPIRSSDRAAWICCFTGRSPKV